MEVFKEISRDTLREKIKDREENFTLIDVRQKPDYSIGHLPHAINIPLDDIELLVPRLVPNKWEDIVVYCDGPSGDVSERAAHLLVGLGYKNVKRFSGGLADWTQAGLPVEDNLGYSNEAA